MIYILTSIILIFIVVLVIQHRKIKKQALEKEKLQDLLAQAAFSNTREVQLDVVEYFKCEGLWDKISDLDLPLVPMFGSLAEHFKNK